MRPELCKSYIFLQLLKQILQLFPIMRGQAQCLRVSSLWFFNKESKFQATDMLWYTVGGC